MWPRPPSWATDMGHESWSLGLAFCPWAAWGLRGQLPVPRGLGRQARAFPVTCSGGWGEPTLRCGFHPPFLTGPGWGRTPRPLASSGLVPTGCFLPLLTGLPLGGAGVGGRAEGAALQPTGRGHGGRAGPLLVPHGPQEASAWLSSVCPHPPGHPWLLADAGIPMELLLLGQMAGNHGVQKVS